MRRRGKDEDHERYLVERIRLYEDSACEHRRRLNGEPEPVWFSDPPLPGFPRPS